MEEVVKLLVVALGSGGLGTIVTSWISSRRAARSEGTEGWRTAVEAQKDAAQAFERMVEDARQEIDALTAQAREAWNAADEYRRGHEDCLQLVQQVRAEHAPCPGRISALEAEVKNLRKSMS